MFYLHHPASLPSTYANNNGNPPYNTNPNINTSATSAKMYKLNGSTGDKTGLNIALKVMAGDQVAIYGKSYWHSNGSSPNNSYTTVVNDLLTALAGTTTIVSAGKGATAAALIGSAVTPSDVSSLLGSPPTVTGRPNAYINWILFDEQFRVVSSNSGFDPVNTSADALKSHTQSVSIPKSGYLYVYCSNESNQDVYFDNLQVIHTRGPLLEETHYYPFGLTMAGISSKAAGKLENRFKYNGIELDTTFGLNEYEAHFRDLDPAIGRWWQIDPKIEKDMENISPYASMFNNPILKSDPLGDEPDGGGDKGILGKAADCAMAGVRWFNANLNPLTPIVEVISGKSVESDLTQDKSRAVAGMEAVVSLIPGGKLEGAIVKTGEKAIVSAVEKYEVGTADNLVSRSIKGDGLDIHHVSQAKPASQVISSYDRKTAPAIALSQAEHKAIPTLRGSSTAGTARQQLAKDIKDLRKYTDAPNSSLQKVINLNKSMYPNDFLKPKH